MLRPCVQPGCGTLVEVGRCATHRLRTIGGDAKPTARERGYGTRWEKARAAFLAANPFCSHHQRLGQAIPGKAVDHIVPHRGNQQIFWDRDNWQALCSSCHGVKGLRERRLRRCAHPATKAVQGHNMCLYCGRRTTRGRGA